MANLFPDDWLTRLKQYQHLFIAFSGGVDSAGLLHALTSDAEITSKLIAVHINHHLHPQADEWQNHCSKLCHQWHVRFIAEQIVVRSKTNVEALARKARYDVFKELVGTDDALVTAHHADDQVETFFLNLLRGAGVTGLASMPESQPFGNGVLLRPLLNTSKQMLLTYAQFHRLSWIDDPSNADCRYQRNWLRHHWIPMLNQRWPKASVNILRSISLLQKAHQSGQSIASVQLQECLETSNRLLINRLLCLTKDEQNNVLRLWLKHHNLNMPTKVQLAQLFKSVIHAKKDANPVWHLSDSTVRRFDGRLYLISQSREARAPMQPLSWANFPKPLQLADRKLILQVTIIGELPNFNQVQIRYRQGGERFFWRGQTRMLKKLLQDWKIPPWQRDSLPLLFIDQELVAVADQAVCDRWQTVMLPLTIVHFVQTQ